MASNQVTIEVVPDFDKLAEALYELESLFRRLEQCFENAGYAIRQFLETVESASEGDAESSN